nr:MAG TPA: hypothetical protein [Caudoviricetes sp.]
MPASVFSILFILMILRPLPFRTNDLNRGLCE